MTHVQRDGHEYWLRSQDDRNNGDDHFYHAEEDEKEHTNQLCDCLSVLDESTEPFELQLALVNCVLSDLVVEGFFSGCANIASGGR